MFYGFNFDFYFGYILDIFIKVNNISKIKGENKLYLYFVMNYIVIFFYNIFVYIMKIGLWNVNVFIELYR